MCNPREGVPEFRHPAGPVCAFAMWRHSTFAWEFLLVALDEVPQEDHWGLNWACSILFGTVSGSFAGGGSLRDTVQRFISLTGVHSSLDIVCRGHLGRVVT